VSSRRKLQQKKHKRGGGERFVKLPHYVLRSFAWSQLGPIDRAVWVELSAIYDGSNNGRIAASTRVLADRLNVGKSTVARALNRLETFGFVELTKKSMFHINKDRSASEYRLTHLPCNVTNALPKHTFMRLAKTDSPTVMDKDVVQAR
jgi:DNA-binding transcriptional regulator YhcF (GntR family)